MPIKLPSFRARRDAHPPDLWTKCPSCGEMLFNKQLEKALRVCPNCGHHFRLAAETRLAQLLDRNSFKERDPGLTSVDPLGFVDQKSYPDRIAAAQLATGMRDAAVWGTGTIDGKAVAICVMDFAFMGGSMGAVVGEKVTRAAEAALEERIPLIVVSASGGARMQEGTLALMQLAKTVGALERLRMARVPYISVMSDPTTGGVFASFAVLGDVNLAEPNALIGFAGARVTAGTIAQELPAGFQRSEFLYEHGFVDRVVHRSELRTEVATLLRLLVPPLPPEADDMLGLPTFRPRAFLSALADRVIPELEPETNGNGTERGRRTTEKAAEPTTEPAEVDRG
jgi:acetyl-CoA carboxylase carboxyl transferase subunit beta